MREPVTTGLYKGKKPPYRYFRVIRVDLKKKKAVVTLSMPKPFEMDEYTGDTRVKPFGWVNKQLERVEE